MVPSRLQAPVPLRAPERRQPMLTADPGGRMRFRHRGRREWHRVQLGSNHPGEGPRSHVATRSGDLGDPRTPIHRFQIGVMDQVVPLVGIGQGAVQSLSGFDRPSGLDLYVLAGAVVAVGQHRSGPIAETANVLIAIGAHAAHRRIADEEVHLGEKGVVHAVHLSVHQRPQRNALKPWWCLDPADVADGGKEVDLRGQRIHHASAGETARTAQVPEDPDAIIAQATLHPRQGESVVGGAHDEGVLPLPRFPQGREDTCIFAYKVAASVVNPTMFRWVRGQSGSGAGSLIAGIDAQVGFRKLAVRMTEAHVEEEALAVPCLAVDSSGCG